MSGVVIDATVPSRVTPMWRDILELTKARIVFMVLLTAATGFVLASPTFDTTLFLSMLAGTALVAAGTNALNEYAERDLDRKMIRTRLRPLPDGRLSERFALWFSLSLAAAGILILFVFNGTVAGLLAILTLTSYLFLYTPLKQTTTWCTLVGAVPGAIPPMIGWAAARGTLEAGAWALFTLMFVWQLPHFFAIAWIYREDYDRAGFKMLSIGDEQGGRTTSNALGYSLLLIPVTFLPLMTGIGGVSYAIGASVAVTFLLAAAIYFRIRRTPGSARRLFAMSNLYLMLVMALLVGARLL